MKDIISKEDLIRCAKEASRKAIEKTRKAGGAITYQHGKKIIKEHPCGRKEVIKVLDRAYIKTKKNVYNIGG